MNQIFLLSGENVDLAREEAIALCGAKKHELNGTVLVVDTNKKDLEKRLAYTHRIYRFLFKCKEKELIKKIKNCNWQKIYKKNFCVRIINLSPKKLKQSEKELAGFIWGRLKNPKVNLENPVTRIEFIFTNKNTYCGLFIAEVKKDFLQRKAHLRPELHPTSLNPKLAKACINLTGAARGTILDPFCGSGGILIEAALMGFDVVAYDIDNTMLKKAKINLDYYKIKNCKLELKDATKITKQFDYVVTDLPYGKNTKNIEKDLYEKFLKNLEKILKNKAVVIFPDWVDYKKLIKKTKLKIENEFSYYVHKSMTKKIVLISRNRVVTLQ